jgi:predicted  nucleic acid-binding Zn-ribbon protein
MQHRIEEELKDLIDAATDQLTETVTNFIENINDAESESANEREELEPLFDEIDGIIEPIMDVLDAVRDAISKVPGLSIIF